MSHRWNASPWIDEVASACEPLVSHLDVDVGIVGAGYTGLSAALALRAAGLSVAVLESRVAGFGASGRNAGHLTPTMGKDPPTLALLFGKERARALLRLAEIAIKHTESLIRDLAIECDYEAVGNLFAAVHEKQYKSIDRAARTAAEFGVAGELLDAGELRARGMPRSMRRGFLEPIGGILNPAKYVRGLRRAALQAGVALFEHTPVERISCTRRPVLTTPRGEVRCRHVVIATNGYTSQLGLARPQIARIMVQLFRTAPLSAQQLDALDWRARTGIYTAHEILESYRLTADGRIVGGSNAVRYGFGNRALPSVDTRGAERMERSFHARFPELREVPVVDHWGGVTGFNMDFVPQVGRTGAFGNILYAAGYCGHGLAMASYAGQMVRDLLLERDGPGSVLWARRSIPFPPEPLRWVASNGLIQLFRAIDSRVARALANERDD